MKLWIARDKFDNKIGLYAEEPIFRKTVYSFEDWRDGRFIGYLDDDGEFSEVTFENSPQEVELKLVKENG